MTLFYGKYGLGPGHAPRCVCPDCAAKFLEHNRDSHCGCIDCTYHREVGAPQPAVIRQPNRYDNDYSSPPRPTPVELSTLDKLRAKLNRSSTYGKKVSTMGNVNMCERKGCNAMIRGTAVGYIDFMPNTLPDTDRVVTEICPACAADIDALMNTEPGNRERGYEKPYVPGKSEHADDVKAATAEQLAAALFEKLMEKRAIEASTVDKDDER